MSITAYKIEAVGHDRTGEDYGYVNIMYRYGNKQPCPRPDQCEKMEVMWANESVYGPPAPGSKVGDSIQTWLMGSWNCGVFTHWEIAQRLMDTFTGLKTQGTGVVREPQRKDTEKRQTPCAPGQVAAGAGGGSGLSLLRPLSLTPEIRLPPKPTFSPSQGWTPGA